MAVLGSSLSLASGSSAVAPATMPASVAVKATSVLAPKPGGTVLGNTLRDLAHRYSGGQFGNGAMLLKDGETTAEYNARILQAAGSAANTFNNNAGTSATTTKAVEAFKAGVISDEVKNMLISNLPKIALAGVGLVLIVKFLKNKKSARK